jgi:hypothetical protein
MLGNYRVAYHLVACRLVFSSIELVSFVFYHIHREERIRVSDSKYRARVLRNETSKYMRCE